MTDFLVQIKIKNARLMRAINATGADNPNQFARTFQICPTKLNEFLNMKKSPLLKTGEWCSAAWAISSAVGREPEELWPEYLRRRELLTNTASFETDADGLIQLAIAGRPEMALTREELLKFANKILNAKQLKVITALLNENENVTREQLGGDLGVSGTRVGQIESRAVRKIREELYDRRLVPRKLGWANQS